MWLRKEGHDDFVDALQVWRTHSCARPVAGISALAIVSTRLNQFPEHGPPSLQRMLQPQHRHSHRSRLRPRQAHNTNAPAARRSCNRDNCVVEVHGEIVAEREKESERVDLPSIHRIWMLEMAQPKYTRWAHRETIQLRLIGRYNMTGQDKADFANH